MLARLKPLAWPIVLVVFAVTLYAVRIHQEMVDFEVYRTAASRALEGENLYRPDDGHYQFKYLPAFAFAMAPFAMVEDRVGRLVWYALSFGLLCAFVRWSVRALPDRRLTSHALIWLAILFVGKYYARELNLGQTNILFGVTLVAALLAAEAGAWRAVGVFVALGVFVKPYALILAPWMLIVAGVPAVVSAAAVMAAGLVLPALAYGWQGNIDQVLGWWRTVTDTSLPNLMVPENVSFMATWTKWIGPGSTAWLMTLLTSIGALGLTAFIMARRRGIREAGYLEFGALMLLVPLLSPQGWDYVLLIGTPAILVLIDRWREMTVPWRAIAAIALVGHSFTIFDVIGRTLYTHAMRINVVSVSAFVLIVCLANLRLRKIA
jgi:hypothetical protein